MKIVLLRHGKPKLNHSKKMTSSEFGAWIDSYNQAPLDKRSLPPAESISIAKTCKAAVCSTLSRSIESANQLGLETKIITSKDFIEAPLPYYNVLNLKFSNNFWLVLFRLFWFLGYAPNSESYSHARLRAKACSDRLIKIAEKSESVIFVGHGILNRLIARELKNKAWNSTTRIKSNYWQFTVYEIKAE